MIVAEANKGWGDTPYTLQPGGCGEEGDYIHLTPSFLLNKTKGHSIVKGRVLDSALNQHIVCYAFSLGPCRSSVTAV